MFSIMHRLFLSELLNISKFLFARFRFDLLFASIAQRLEFIVHACQEASKLSCQIRLLIPGNLHGFEGRVQPLWRTRLEFSARSKSLS